MHVLRGRMGYPELKRAVREQAQAFATNVVLIEDKASGTQLIHELVAEGPLRDPPLRDRKFADSALEQKGFELVVPPREGGAAVRR